MHHNSSWTRSTSVVAPCGIPPTATVNLSRSSANGLWFLFSFYFVLFHSRPDSVIDSVIDRFKRTGKRNEIFISTKVGYVFGDRMVNGEPEYLKSAVEKSLSRLGVDQIDLLYLHRADLQTPIEVKIPRLVLLDLSTHSNISSIEID